MNDNVVYTCLDCHVVIEKDDNYCYKCGSITAKGYKELSSKTNVNNGILEKQNYKLRILIVSLSLLIIIFAIIILVRGNDIMKPLAYLKKQYNSYKNGYNSSILKTDNVYNNIDIYSYEDAIDFLKNDIEKQDYLCSNNYDVKRIEYDLEDNYNIASVSFCDMQLDESDKISEVIDKMYELFPNIKGALTNITITNAPTKDEYIAYFQPMYQFVNPSEKIQDYNKVNKTQILLNSYYFLNKTIISKPIEDVVGKNWYVKDASWESTIAHELGHYISFKILLKENNLDNITFVTPDNEEIINKVLKDFDSQEFSSTIVKTALNSYNLKYNTNLNMFEFAKTISEYASTKDKKGNIITDETIAEAIHDYYLHKDNLTKASFEIINVIKMKLR